MKPYSIWDLLYKCPTLSHKCPTFLYLCYMSTRKEQAKQMFQSGKSKTEIAQTLGVTRKTVQRDLSNVTPNVPLQSNVPLPVKNVPLNVPLPKQNVPLNFKRYKKPGQKFLSKQNIEDMVKANDLKIKALKEKGEVRNLLEIEQTFKRNRAEHLLS